MAGMQTYNYKIILEFNKNPRNFSIFVCWIQCALQRLESTIWQSWRYIALTNDNSNSLLWDIFLELKNDLQGIRCIIESFGPARRYSI